MQRRQTTLALLAVLTACSLPKVPPKSAPLTSGSWVGRFAGSQAALTGDARLVPARSSSYTVQFDVRSMNPTARLPWSIRSGRCGETSAVVLTTPAVPHIEGRPDRTASLKTEVALTLQPGREYHVALGAGVHQPDNVIACGALVYVP
jgi:hypothetical protein